MSAGIGCKRRTGFGVNLSLRSLLSSLAMVWWLSFSPQRVAAAADPQVRYTS